MKKKFPEYVRPSHFLVNKKEYLENDKIYKMKSKIDKLLI